MPIVKLDQSSAMRPRDRRGGAGGSSSGFLSKLCCPCFAFGRFWKTLSMGDKILTVLTFVLLVANLTIQFNPSADDSFSGAFGKIRGMFEPPPSPPPTPAPTPANVEESPEDVASSVASFNWGGGVAAFAKPAECSSDVINKVKKSGMDGSDCRGQPYTQACSHSVLTKAKSATWLSGFITEVTELRAAGKGGGEANATFVSSLIGIDCASLSKRLSAPSEIPEQLTKWPWLFCSEPYDSPETTKWGKVAVAPTEINLDVIISNKGLREAVKDAVLIDGGEKSATAMESIRVTLARTRYVEFDYDWKGPWGSKNLKDIVAGMDAIGHTCYWAGNEKLWRITACWQDAYSFRSWSHLACVNRVLAPKTSKVMEDVFMKTIGAS